MESTSIMVFAMKIPESANANLIIIQVIFILQVGKSMNSAIKSHMFTEDIGHNIVIRELILRQKLKEQILIFFLI